jgi:hypothetical protein
MEVCPDKDGLLPGDLGTTHEAWVKKPAGLQAMPWKLRANLAVHLGFPEMDLTPGPPDRLEVVVHVISGGAGGFQRGLALALRAMRATTCASKLGRSYTVG